MLLIYRYITTTQKVAMWLSVCGFSFIHIIYKQFKINLKILILNKKKCVKKFCF